MTFLGTRLYGVRNIRGCLTDRMTSRIVICSSSYFLKTSNWVTWKSQKTDCHFAKFFNDFDICESQTDNNHNWSFLWYDAVSTEKLLCFRKASTIRRRLPLERLSIKIWVCQNNFMSAVIVYIVNCGLSCKIAQKIFGHCVYQTARTESTCRPGKLSLLPTQHVQPVRERAGLRPHITPLLQF